MLLHVDQIKPPLTLGPVFVFRIDRRSAYTGEINKYFLNWDFIQDPILFSFRFRQISLYIDKDIIMYI